VSEKFLGILGRFKFFAASRQLPVLEKIFLRKIAYPKKSRGKNFNSENQTNTRDKKITNSVDILYEN